MFKTQILTMFKTHINSNFVKRKLKSYLVICIDNQFKYALLFLILNLTFKISNGLFSRLFCVNCEKYVNSGC